MQPNFIGDFMFNILHAPTPWVEPKLHRRYQIAKGEQNGKEYWVVACMGDDGEWHQISNRRWYLVGYMTVTVFHSIDEARRAMVEYDEIHAPMPYPIVVEEYPTVRK